MALPIGPILGILSDNLRKRGSVLPLTKKASTGWANGLNIPEGGETVLYTGHMYQLIPAIDAMSGQMAMFENSPITKFFGLGRFANKFVNMSFFMSLLAKKELKDETNNVLRRVAKLLTKAGVSYGYLYGKELYSGALVYDEGMDDTFEAHARKVFKMFKDNGVKSVITVDPHTTNMLNDVYRKLIPEFDIEVKSYLEVLAEKAPKAINKVSDEVSIHDSCVYARYEGLVDQPRELLKNAGVAIKEPQLCGKSTHCCGGPIESLFPTEAHRIANERIEQLQGAKNGAVTMCPICWVNLNKAAGDKLAVKDISEVLEKAYI
jgi:Fe-S oxidoreductase